MLSCIIRARRRCGRRLAAISPVWLGSFAFPDRSRVIVQHLVCGWRWCWPSEARSSRLTCAAKRQVCRSSRNSDAGETPDIIK